MPLDKTIPVSLPKKQQLQVLVQQQQAWIPDTPLRKPGRTAQTKNLSEPPPQYLYFTRVRYKYHRHRMISPTGNHFVGKHIITLTNSELIHSNQPPNQPNPPRCTLQLGAPFPPLSLFANKLTRYLTRRERGKSRGGGEERR